MMTFDVLIPVYKPDGKFEKLLERIERQSLVPERILIANTEKRFWDEAGLDDRVTEILLRSNIEISVTHITRQEFDHGGTRKFLAEQSRADVFICMTQDAVPGDRYLFEKMLRNFEDPKVGAVYARQMTDSAAGEIERYTRSFNYPAKRIVKDRENEAELGIKAWFCSDVCAAWRKQAYEAAGGFVPRTVFNEDMVLASQMIEKGYQIVYEPEARVLHYHEYSAAEQFHRNFDLGASHREFSELFGRVRSESEGISMVKKTVKHLALSGHAAEIPRLIIQSGAKYLGYRLGKMYPELPKELVIRLASNKEYFRD